MEMLFVILVTGMSIAILDCICLCIGLVKVKDKMKGDDI